MAKKLIITEKPSVARDFARVLGVSGNKNGYIENGEYVISWCVGHLVEMVYPEEYDEKYRKWKLEDLPFLPAKYKYGVIKRSAEQYRIVHELLHRDDIDTVYWAGDSGKEGQTIEENIRNFGGVRDGMTELRVWIDSMTDDEVRRGIAEAKPMSDYALLGESGIMRAIEDYSLGINFSRALSVKYGRLINDAAATKQYTAIAIGRVMTCVLGMVVRREREIRNFVKTPFFRVVGSFSDANIQAEWKAVKGSSYFESPRLYKENGFKEKEDAEKLIESLDGKKAVIENIESGTSKKRAPLLYNLTELQADCTKRFKISPSQTLDIAQELYEKKLTTYPRTDARVLTTAVAKEISKNIRGLSSVEEVSGFADNVLKNGMYKGVEKSVYTDDSKVTDHYAIIPTGNTQALNSLTALAKNVYLLICRRFMAIFYPPAEYRTAKLQVAVQNERFFATAKVLTSPGYLEVIGRTDKASESKGDGNPDIEEDVGISREDFIRFVSSARKGNEISVSGYSIKEGATSPPKRYTSGDLAIAMENAGNLIEDEELREQIKKKGIGTAATRAGIIQKLIDIKYLNQSKNQIITPENLGEMIYEVVNLSVPTLLNPEITASWEKGLEGIYNGSVDAGQYREKLEDYIRRETGKMIGSDLTSAILGNIREFADAKAKGPAARKPIGAKCPVCGGEMTTTSFGYGCSNYFDEEKKCSFSIGKIAGKDLTTEQVLDILSGKETEVIKGFKSKSKKEFSARLSLKRNEEGKPEIAFGFDGIEPDYLEGVVCPDCGGRIIKKAKGFGCENFRAEDENSCRFFVGKICQKQLSESSVLQLLKEGHTGTIRGFKGKNGKKFDACLVLKKSESGSSEIVFDFENVEAQVVNGAVCPICGGEIVKTSFGYGCSNYNRDDPEKSCKFNLGTIAGKKLTDSNVKELLQNGITPVINGFKSKSGKTFEARLALNRDEAGRVSGIKFVFENEDEVLENLKCPVCGGRIIKGHFGYRCEANTRKEDGCSFFVGKVAGVFLTVEDFTKLINEKETDKISGFTSKKGTTFDARLAFDDKFNVVFKFD